MSFKVKSKDIYLRLKRISGLFLCSFILASVSQASLNGKASSTDDQQHPVVVNQKKPDQLRYARVVECTKEFMRKEIIFPESKENVEIALDSRNNIYVLDRESALIKVFDQAGSLIRQFGGKGEEKDKMLLPNNLIITPQGEVMIRDKMKFLLYFFSPQGKLLRTIPYSLDNLGEIRFTAGDDIIADTLVAEDSKFFFELARYDKELNHLKTLVSLEVTEVFNRLELLYFGHYIGWKLTNDEKIVVGKSDQYIFYIYDLEGNLLKEIRKECEPVKVTPEEREQELGRASPQAIERLKKMVYHKPFRDFTIDQKNRLIVRTWEKASDGKGYYYDVFDSGGLLAGRFSGDFSIKLWLDGKFMAVEDLSDEKSVLKIYNLDWN